MSKLLIVADKLREIWADYTDTNIFLHYTPYWRERHQIPEWQLYLAWPQIRKMLRKSSADIKRPFVFAELYEHGHDFRAELSLPRTKKSSLLGAGLRLAAKPLTRKWGEGKHPIEMYDMSARTIFHFTGEEGKALWNEWLNLFLSDEKFRTSGGLPPRVNNEV